MLTTLPERACNLPADRANVDNPSGDSVLSTPTPPKELYECLGDDERPEEIHFELPTKFADRLVHKRGRYRHAGVIHQAEECFPFQHGLNCGSRQLHRLRVGDIEDQGMELQPKLRGNPFCVSLFANAAEHAKAFLDENFRRPPTDPSGDSCNDNRLHCVPAFLPTRTLLRRYTSYTFNVHKVYLP
jgi:hypothetical protein